MVTALSGETIDIRVDTICLHGDGAHALEFAVALRSAFAENRIDVQAFDVENTPKSPLFDDLFSVLLHQTRNGLWSCVGKCKELP